MNRKAVEQRLTLRVVIHPDQNLSVGGKKFHFRDRDWIIISKILMAAGANPQERIRFSSLTKCVYPDYSLAELHALTQRLTQNPGCSPLIQQDGLDCSPRVWIDARVKTTDKPTPVTEVVVAQRGGFARKGMSSLLEESPKIKVVGSVGNYQELDGILSKTNPDVLFTSLDLPSDETLSPYDKLEQLSQQSAIVLLIPNYRDYRYGMLSLCAFWKFIGAFVDSEYPQEPIKGILSAYSGRRYISPQLLAKNGMETVDDFYKLVHSTQEPNIRFTTRELEIIRLLGRGFTNNRVAEIFSLSDKTVETHRAHILEKVARYGDNKLSQRLGLLTGLALALGLIRPEDVGESL